MFEVIGQERVWRSLNAALESGRIAQAYLFSGPRGVGKYSSAVRFAAGLNCQGAGPGRPCGGCSSCRNIAAGVFPDLHLPKASTTGITKNAPTGSKDTGYLADIVPRLSFAPVSGRWKVVLLNDAHRLTDTAANYLLKTLEEPPSQTVFILCSDAEHAILDTVKSRCRRVRFPALSVGAIEQVVLRSGAEPAAAAGIALAADGSAGRALEMLDPEYQELRRDWDLWLQGLLEKRGAGKDLGAALRISGKNMTERMLLERFVSHLKGKVINMQATSLGGLVAKNDCGVEALLAMVQKSEGLVRANCNPKILADWITRELCSLAAAGVVTEMLNGR